MATDLTVSNRRKQLTAFLAISLAGVSAVRGAVCPICMLFPKKTAADFLIECESVVLAREDPEEPFSYVAVEVLKGGSDVRRFGLFVDSNTRRILKTNVDDTVVLVRKDDDEVWRSLGVANHEYQEVVKRILALSDQWSRKGGAEERYKFFLPLFGSKNRTMVELAYLELGRAPYRTIKKMANLISQNKIRPMLHRREYLEWRPLAILLTAQNPTEDDRRLIEDSFHSCHRFSLTTNLAAWATAYIELHGADAVKEVEEKYLRDPNRTETEVRASTLALSVHGRNGPADLRDQIVKTYGVALQNHPKIAGSVARDLAEWGKTDFRKELARLLAESEIKFEDWQIQAIKDYIE